jgi:hypothetical protein
MATELSERPHQATRFGAAHTPRANFCLETAALGACQGGRRDERHSGFCWTRPNVCFWANFVAKVGDY